MCESSGFLSITMTLIIGGGCAALGVLIGYAAGRRKAFLDALKKAMDEISNKKALEQLKKDMKGGDDQDQQDEDEDKSKLDEAKEMLQQFLNRGSDPGLDDHPQAFVNPIFMLQIRRKKDEVRREKMYETLLAAQEFEEGYLEGLSKQEKAKLAESLMEQSGSTAVVGGVGSVNGVVRRWGAAVNSTRILVDAGATLVPGEGSGMDDASIEEKLSMEIRDKIKQIDTHLSKHYEIDVHREERNKVKRRNADGKRVKDALTVANDTKTNPFQTSQEVLTLDERRDFAQRGRARVAPPMDHAGDKNAGGRVRRASAAGNALALEQAMQDAKQIEMKDLEAMQTALAA